VVACNETMLAQKVQAYQVNNIYLKNNLNAYESRRNKKSI
jgi:hypothetical protein